MKKVRYVGRLAVMTLLVTLSSNLTFAYTKPNANEATRSNRQSKVAPATAVITEKQLLAEIEKIDMAALAETTEMKTLLNKISKDKALVSKAGMIMQKNISGQEKAALLVSAFRPYFADWFECVGTCLRSAGVSAYALLVCAITCVVTLGIGCAICLGVAVGLTELCGALCAKEMVQLQENAN